MGRAVKGGFEHQSAAEEEQVISEEVLHRCDQFRVCCELGEKFGKGPCVLDFAQHREAGTVLIPGEGFALEVVVSQLFLGIYFGSQLV